MDSINLKKEMLAIVKSDEAKKVFEEGLKNLDPKALSPDGVIQSYELDYDSIKRNPMGGIDGVLFINKNQELYVYVHLNKYDGENLEGGDGGLSGKLSDMLKKRQTDD